MNNDLIRVDGKFYEKCQVVMLPTNDRKLSNNNCNRIAKHRKLGFLQFCKGFDLDIDEDFKQQHLYILSNEEIKEGDYVIDDTGLFGPVEREDVLINPKKIIATTDESLKIKVNDYSIGTIHYAGYEGVMARPSNEFLKKFCEVDGIWEVLVEYERDLIKYSCSVAFDGNYEGQCPICKKQEHWMGTGGMKCYNHFKLKVKPDNTISIKPIKDSWSHNEVSLKLMYAISEFAAGRGLTPTSKEMKGVNDWTNNWIKENL